MFIDEAKIRVKAGMAGMAACVPAGRSLLRGVGPPAATAARVATSSWNRASGTTRWYTSASIPNTTAQRGRHGEGSNKTGRDGDGIVLKVPVGTIVFDDETGEKIFESLRPIRVL